MGTYLGLAAVVFALGGCPKKEGPFKGHNKSSVFLNRFIVVKQNDGKITDVYKLQPNESEDSPRCTMQNMCSFYDGKGHLIDIVGDMKIITLQKDDSLWSKYCEYHQEFDARLYNEACPAGEVEKN